MNYVYPTDTTFTVHFELMTRKQTSDQSRAIEHFIDTHNFSVLINSNTGEPIVKVLEKDAPSAQL